MCITETTREADILTDSHIIYGASTHEALSQALLIKDYDRAQRSQTPYANV